MNGSVFAAALAAFVIWKLIKLGARLIADVPAVVDQMLADYGTNDEPVHMCGQCRDGFGDAEVHDWQLDDPDLQAWEQELAQP